jgi:hypothetical protein
MRKNKIGKDLLKYLALGGLVTIAMLSPINGHKVAGDLLRHVKYKLKQLKNNAHYLKKRGLIEFVKETSKNFLISTIWS